MKKDIKWLKEQILILKENRITERDNSERHSEHRWFYNGMLSSIGLILDFINKLDEPEVLSQKWIDEHSTVVTYNGLKDPAGVIYVEDLENLIVPKQQVLSQGWIDDNKVARIDNLRKMTTSDVVPVDELQDLLVSKHKMTFNQAHDKLREESILSEKSFDYYWNCINDNVEIDEPGNLNTPIEELPVIPQFVADYLEKAKEEIDLLRVFEIANGLDELDMWRKEYNWIRLYHLDFARAWLYDYAVEEEPLYYALLKGHELIIDRGCMTPKYWKLDTSNGRVFPSHIFTNHSIYVNEMTKEDWNGIDINDSNADFVKVEKKK